MKVFLILLTTLLFFTNTANAQLQKGTGFLSARTGYLDINEFGPRIYGGLEFEFMVQDKLSIHYSLLFGEKYFHMPLAPVGGLFAGIAVGMFVSKDSTKNGIGAGILVGLLTAIIPEGIAYTIPITKRQSISPYISPLQFEIIKANEESNAYAGGALGLRFHHYSKSESFRISPFFEYKIHYHKNLHPGFSTGLNFSLVLK